jgi:hypothetical protein
MQSVTTTNLQRRNVANRERWRDHEEHEKV